MTKRQRIVVVGHGMVGHRFAQAAVERGLTETHDVLVLGEEPRAAYDRVALTSWFGSGSDALSLLPGGEYDDPRVRLVLDSVVTEIDRAARTVTVVSPPSAVRRDLLANPGAVTVHEYDVLVLATGAAPFVPPVEGRGKDGCFVYRTIEDLEAIRAASAAATSGVVIGGGLLGLEAANALVQLGLDTHVVEMAPRLMPVQLDGAAGATLVRHIERLGVSVHTGVVTEAIGGARRSSVTGLRLRQAGTEEGAPTEVVDAQVVVFSAGIRPRDALARECDLEVAPRGGVLVDEQCRTADPHVFAIGECAAPGGTMYGLVAPGYAMAEVVVDALLDGPGAFTGADMSTKLKLLGIDVASFGDAFATTDGALELTYADAVAGVYKKLVVSDDGRRLLGGILVGDASAYGVLRPMVSSGLALPDNPEQLILPASSGVQLGMPDEAQVCSCNDVIEGRHPPRGHRAGLRDRGGRQAVHASGLDVRLVRGDGEERHRGPLRERRQGRRQGAVRALPAHPAGALRRRRGARLPTLRRHRRRARHRPRLRHLQAGDRLASWPARPTPTSSTASRGRCRTPTTHFLANIQRNGTYSVVPRIPGGEITPDKLIVIGEVARDFGLYTKITGGQRIDLLRRPGRAAARDLAAARRGGLRVRARLRQGAAHGEVVRRVDLVPLRRAGLGRARDRAGAALPRPARPAQAQVGGVAAARASAPRRAARTSASSRPRTAGTSTSAATAAARPRHAELLAQRPRPPRR